MIMAVFGLAREPARLPIAPIGWTPNALTSALQGLNPRNAEHRDTAERYLRTLKAALRVEIRGHRFAADVDAVFKVPPKSLPIQVLVYREYCEYLSLWLSSV
jgi:hypothetical protein